MKAKDIFFSIILLIPVGIFAQPEIILNSYPDFMRHKSPELLAEIAGEWVPISATSTDSTAYDSKIFVYVGKANIIKIGGVENIFPHQKHCFQRIADDRRNILSRKYNLFK